MFGKSAGCRGCQRGFELSHDVFNGVVFYSPARSRSSGLGFAHRQCVKFITGQVGHYFPFPFTLSFALTLTHTPSHSSRHPTAHP